MNINDLDHPFIEEVTTDGINYIVLTPAGEELVTGHDLEEPTRVYSGYELRLLLGLTHPDKYPTVPDLEVFSE